MTAKKSYKGNEVVLKCVRTTKKGKEEFEVTPNSFSFNDFKGVKVSGEDYYVAKAVKAGATK